MYDYIDVSERERADGNLSFSFFILFHLKDLFNPTTVHSPNRLQFSLVFQSYL